MPLHPFLRQMEVRILLMACRDIYCEETSLFKYIYFFRQNAEPLRPLPFRPQIDVYSKFTIFPPTPFSKANGGQDRCLSEIFQILPLHPFLRQMEVRILLMACRSIYCEETSLFKYFIFFRQNAEPLRPLPFRPQIDVYLNLQYLPLHPFLRQMEVRILLMACRSIYCEETSLFKYFIFFRQNAEPLRPLPFRPQIDVYSKFTIFAPTPFSKANGGQDPSHGM